MTWSDLKIYQFQELYSIITDKELDDLGKMIYAMAYMEDKPVAEIEGYSLKQYNELCNKYSWLQQIDLPEQCQRKYVHGGVNYEIVYEFDKLKAGQYIDLNQAAKDPIANMHEIMATLVYDRWENYSTEHKRRAQLFRETMPISFAYPWAVFFCNVLVKSAPFILKHLTNKMKKASLELTIQRKKDSINTGIGFIRSILFPNGQVKHGRKSLIGGRRNS